MVETWNPNKPAVGNIVLNDVPDIEENFSYLMARNGYLADSSEADQGVTAVGSGDTVKDLVDTIGDTKIATIFLPHLALDGNTTTYTFSTNESIPDNITLKAQPGALISVDLGVTLTLDNTSQIKAGAKQQVFAGSGNVTFTNGGSGWLYWWGIESATDDYYFAGNVGIGTSSPGNKLDVNGTAAIGDGTNQTVVESDGTVKFEGTATVWDDYVVPLGPNNWNGASNNPVLTKLFDDGAGSTGVYGYVYTNDDESLVTVQMPHRWKEGSTIYPHIHFMCTSDVSPTDEFGIEFEYAWADIGEDFPANSTLVTIDHETGVNTDNMHQLTNLTASGIDGTGHTISSVLMCRIKRVAADSNDYADGIAILDFDIHYEVDTVGSRTVTAK